VGFSYDHTSRTASAIDRIDAHDGPLAVDDGVGMTVFDFIFSYFSFLGRALD